MISNTTLRHQHSARSGAPAGSRNLRFASRTFAVHLLVLGLHFGLTGVGGITEARAQADEVKDVVFPDPPPKSPEAANQIEFFSLPDSKNQYWLDLASIVVLDNENVRFSTQVVSESGVRNLRHEAFRCKQAERKLLAIGRSDGSWSVTSSSPWQPIRLGSNTNQGYPELYRALCFGGANADRDKVVERIRNGVKVGNF